MEARAKVEARLRQLEGRMVSDDAGRPRGKQQPAPYEAIKQQAAGTGGLAAGAAKAYNADADVVQPAAAAETQPEEKKKDKKDKKDKKKGKHAEQNGVTEAEPVKKKKKREADGDAAADGEKKKKKKKKSKDDE
eukprot:GHRR01021268.1.p3 GENE.GHRR01021268.1~~GHRR01021268.1.p3  ORF type:complete len:134 (+),score=86.83 GHRR01021268.1:2431-2832(+)